MSGAVAAATLAAAGPAGLVTVYTTAITDVVGGQPAVADVAYTSAGDINRTDHAGTTDVGDWVSPKALASGNYTVRAHLVSGTSPTGSALDTDLALSSNRDWGLTEAAVGTLTCVLTITIKYLGITLQTGNITLTAQRTS